MSEGTNKETSGFGGTSGISQPGQVVNHTEASGVFWDSTGTLPSIVFVLEGGFIEEETPELDISSLLLSDKNFRKSIETAREEMRSGKYLTHEEVFGN